MNSSNNADLFNRLQIFRSRSQDNLEAVDLEGESNQDGAVDPGGNSQRKRVDPTNSTVKRCLFGRGNSEENIKFAKRELEKINEDSKSRWNFDFQNERPLEGRFVWQTSPYPKPIKSNINAISNSSNTTSSSDISEENSENLHPEKIPPPPKHTSSSSVEQSTCDQPAGAVAATSAAHALPEAENSSISTSDSSSSGPGSPRSSQRTNRQPKLNGECVLLLKNQIMENFISLVEFSRKDFILCSMKGFTENHAKYALVLKYDNSK